MKTHIMETVSFRGFSAEQRRADEDVVCRKELRAQICSNSRDGVYTLVREFYRYKMVVVVNFSVLAQRTGSFETGQLMNLHRCMYYVYVTTKEMRTRRQVEASVDALREKWHTLENKQRFPDSVRLG
ncbi:hypothetical protein RUM43_002956 [Polyplax serrata]|uniref:Uncharacterized protein n=1 Tax=Polyplax serrata TaxID=468196 RepID=A0AAN8S6A6_POLSC